MPAKEKLMLRRKNKKVTPQRKQFSNEGEVTKILVQNVCPDLKYKFRIRCAEKKVTMTKAIIDFMEKYIA